MDEIKPGTWWRHHNGNMYRVLFMMNEWDQAQYPKQVAYQGENGKYWCRFADSWHVSMTLVPDYKPKTVASQEVYHLMGNETFRKEYVNVAESIFNIRQLVPGGVTISVPGGKLEIF